MEQQLNNEELADCGLLSEIEQKQPSKLKGRKLEPKYKDPETGKTWAGRGRLPRWLIGDKEQYKL